LTLQQHKQVLVDDAKMDELLLSHQIPVQALRTDDFETFFEHRKLALLDLIAKTMEKQIVRSGSASQ
jgi:hypothetical protein